MMGPLRKLAYEAIAAWNALPRWEWVPASQPPEVPEGRPDVKVLAAWPAEVGTAYYDGKDWWHGDTPTSRPPLWMPLQPAPVISHPPS